MTETAPFHQNRLAAAGSGAPGIPLGATLLCAAGGVAVGLSPILVRLSDVGPQASAFWRAALALPLLWLWMRIERGRAKLSPRGRSYAWLAGLFFAGDLAFWHLSIHHTTLANATFLAVTLPVLFVALAAWALFAERPSRRYASSVVLALCGAALLLGSSARLDPANLQGDVYAVATAAFFSAYVLALKAGGEGRAAGASAFHATLATTAGLALAFWASGETAFWPQSTEGWAVLLALGLLCQGAGQGAVVAALRALPAGFAAMLLMIEPITAAVVAWALLGEAMSPLQMLGGALAMAAIVTARGGRRGRRVASRREG